MNVQIEETRYVDVVVDPKIADEMLHKLLKVGPLPATADDLQDALVELVRSEAHLWLDGSSRECSVDVYVDADEFAELERRHLPPEVIAKRPIPGQLTIDGEEVPA